MPHLSGPGSVTGEILGSDVLPFRNKIINGDFDIAQRGSSFALTGGAYTLDRWICLLSGSMLVTVTQDSTVPTVAESGHLSLKSIKVDCTQNTDGDAVNPATNPLGATNQFGIVQRIEGYNFRNLAQKPFVLSFWVRATKTGTYCVAFRNSTADRSYVAEYTIDSSNTWEKKTIVVSASPSAGTWDYNSGKGLEVYFTLVAGGDYDDGVDGTWVSSSQLATSNQVNGLDSTLNDFFLSQVQMEVGAEASQFQTHHFGQEVALCQRYYCKSYNLDYAPSTAAVQDTAGLVSFMVDYNSTTGKNEGGVTVSFPVNMRPTPTVYVKNYYTGNNTRAAQYSSGGDEIVALSMASTSCFEVVVNDTSIANGVPNRLRFHWYAESEL